MNLCVRDGADSMSRGRMQLPARDDCGDGYHHLGPGEGVPDAFPVADGEGDIRASRQILLRTRQPPVRVEPKWIGEVDGVAVQGGGAVDDLRSLRELDRTEPDRAQGAPHHD